MLVAVDTSATREYTLKSDVRPKALTEGEPWQPTVFEIGVLDGILGPMLLDKHTVTARKNRDSTVDMKPGSYMLDIVRFGLRGWKNFADKDGKPVEFIRTQMQVLGVGMRWVADDRCIAKLQSEWMSELSDAILNANQLSEDDVKNFEPPSGK